MITQDICPPLKISHDEICETATWSSVGKTVAGGNGPGSAHNQLSNPFGIFVDSNDDDALIIVDNGNGRVMKWQQGASSGQIIAGNNGIGNRSDQLDSPRYITVDQEGTLFITEYTNKRVSRWKKGARNGEIIISNIYANGIALGPIQAESQHLFVGDWYQARILKFNKNGTGEGQVVIGGKGPGASLEQLITPYQMYVDQQESIFVPEYANSRITKWIANNDIWATSAIIVAGGNGNGSQLNQLEGTLAVTVDRLGTVYAADYGNHRITRWLKGAKSGTIIVGGNGQGNLSTQLNHPYDLAFDRDGNFDLWNNAMKSVTYTSYDDLKAKYDKYSIERYFLEHENMSRGAVNFISLMYNVDMQTSLIEMVRSTVILTLDPEYSQIDGGFDLLIDALERDCKSVSNGRCSIHTNTPVKGVHYVEDLSNSSIRPWVRLVIGKNSTSIRFDSVIVSTTARAASLIQFEPRNLFTEKYHALRVLHYDCATKIAHSFSRQFWRDENIQGGYSITDLPIRFVFYNNFNTTSNQVTDGGFILTSYVWATDALLWSALSNEQTCEKSLQDLIQLHNRSDIRSLVISCEVQNWCTDQYTHGAYALFTPNQETNLHNELGKSIKNIIHFSGEHISYVHRWVEGAIQSSMRVLMHYQTMMNTLGLNLSINLYEHPSAIYFRQLRSTPANLIVPTWRFSSTDNHYYAGYPPDQSGYLRIEPRINPVNMQPINSPYNRTNKPDKQILDRMLTWVSQHLSQTINLTSPIMPTDTTLDSMLSDGGFILDYIPGFEQKLVLGTDSWSSIQYLPAFAEILARLVVTNGSSTWLDDYASLLPEFSVNIKGRIILPDSEIIQPPNGVS
ncbi:unnamed protein product, partial [Rotaria sp. Silwood2]